MADQFTRNPVVTRFATGDQQRHQIHQDRRRPSRRVKHRLRDRPEYDSE